MMKQSEWERLHDACPNIGFDLPIDIDLSTHEVDIIIQAYKKSSWLRLNVRSLYKLYKWLPRLAMGYYDDYKQPLRTHEAWKCDRIKAEQVNALFTCFDDND